MNGRRNPMRGLLNPTDHPETAGHLLLLASDVSV